MEGFEEYLSGRLRGFERLAVLGVGSTLRADDAAGVRIVERLGECAECAGRPDLLLIAGETAPENFSGTIRKYRPTHLLVLDAADLGLEPGGMADLCPKDVGGPTFCSHMLPLKIMIDYLVAETGASVTLLGIQPKSLAFDGAMSPEVEGAVQSVCDALIRIVSVK